MLFEVIKVFWWGNRVPERASTGHFEPTRKPHFKLAMLD